MKKILTALALLVTAGTASAQWHHHYGYRPHYYGGYYGSGWVAPAIIGGVIGYELSRPRPVIVEQQPQTVIIQQQQPVDTNCSPWTETQNPDGTITRTRTCAK
jgi:hypothetical protein